MKTGTTSAPGEYKVKAAWEKPALRYLIGPLFIFPALIFLVFLSDLFRS
jgi:hypothetical protein